MNKTCQNVASLIASFLEKHKLSKTLEKLQKEANVKPSNDIDLETIFQAYLAQNTVNKKRKREESSSDDSSSDDSSSDDSSSDDSSSDDSSSDDSSSDDSSSDDSSSDDSSSDESSSDDSTISNSFSKKREELLKKKAMDAKAAAEQWMNTSMNSPEPERPAKKPRVSGEAFRRVDSDIWINEVKLGLEDNSYIKTFGNDGYGAKANKILAAVKGKDFRHEKTKKKRGGYRGGSISIESNSFKYSDE